MQIELFSISLQGIEKVTQYAALKGYDNPLLILYKKCFFMNKKIHCL